MYNLVHQLFLLKEVDNVIEQPYLLPKGWDTMESLLHLDSEPTIEMPKASSRFDRTTGN